MSASIAERTSALTSSSPSRNSVACNSLSACETARGTGCPSQTSRRITSIFGGRPRGAVLICSSTSYIWSPNSWAIWRNNGSEALSVPLNARKRTSTGTCDVSLVELGSSKSKTRQRRFRVVVLPAPGGPRMSRCSLPRRSCSDRSGPVGWEPRKRRGVPANIRGTVSPWTDRALGMR